MLERIFGIIRKENKKHIRESTWRWVHSLIVDDQLEQIYNAKVQEIQLGIDDLLAQIYDSRHDITLSDVVSSVESAGAKPLGHVFGLIYRHGTGWNREEVFELSKQATSVFRTLSRISEGDAQAFIETIKLYNPGIIVENDWVDMNITKGYPQPIDTCSLEE